MKVSDVYGKSKKLPVPDPAPLPKPPLDGFDKSGMLCKSGINIWLGHKWSSGWICKRCGFQLDTKELFKK